jgi:pimeloyl-ACP methyl ester carboxylesterase
MTAPAQPVAPVEARIAATGGVRLAVRRWEPPAGIAPGGDGDERTASVPVLAVHGLASNARLWDGVAAHLTGLGHPVAAVDLRGHGRSDKPDDGYDFGTLAGDLTAVMTALGWTAPHRRPLVAGQSFGANLALELAIRHPEAILAVACVDGGTIELTSQFADWEQARASLTPPRLEGMPAADFEAALRAMHPDWPETGIRGALGNVELRADGTVAPWLTLERHLAILRQLWEHRPSERYALVPVPVLLIPADGGDGGWAAARRTAVARAEAAMPKVRTRWLAGDHDLHAQYPTTIAELLDQACRPEFWS